MINSFEEKFNKLKETYDDFCFLGGRKKILLSAPHSVSQTRDGVVKPAEPETAIISLFFNEKNYPCIIKTTNNSDDANHSLNSNYKTKMLEIFNSEKVKFLIDLHELNSKREMDFCIGIGGENYNNLLSYSYITKQLIDIFNNSGYTVEINNPFGAGKPHTNAGFIARKGFPSIQLEINSRLVFGVSEQEFFKVIFTIEKILNYIEKELN
ncbi:MAG: N-formylglutamate amidohydrolase [Clostridia bacterium]|nr:N-formylglutamate amidohydrolase [Clostridia bacterium]